MLFQGVLIKLHSNYAFRGCYQELRQPQTFMASQRTALNNYLRATI